MLFWVCECACWPLTCVMGVVVGVSGWCCFQCCVAVVPASSVVPGVLVWGVCVLVCSGVVWLVPGVSGAKACVAGLVCVLWFRMLMRVPLSVFFCFVVLVLLVCFVNNAAWAGWVGLVRRAGRVLGLCGYWVVVLVVGESVCLWALVCL